MKAVYVLEHTHDFDDGHEDLKIIGVFSTRENAETALERVRDQPGFRSRPDGFSIDEWMVDPTPDHLGWAEGFITVLPDGTELE
jgi:hypothetical protein